MIRVTRQPEPAGFDANVRKPGQAFLAAHAAPSSNEFKQKAYWKWAATELYEAYRHVCAYSCAYMPTPTGTIDHFLPKSVRPDLAYEWDNYRLAQYKMNIYKGDRTDVIDPFTVQPGWFVLDTPSCLIRPGTGLPAQDVLRIETTIRVLKLNDDDSLVQDRCDIMVMFAQGDVNLGFLQQRYPFLAAEVVRQGIQQTAATIFKSRP